MENEDNILHSSARIFKNINNRKYHFSHSLLNFAAKDVNNPKDASISFSLVGFYGISTILGYLMPIPFYTHILNIYDLVWLGLWHINHCRLFNANSFLYIYIKYIWFGLVGFMAYQPF